MSELVPKQAIFIQNDSGMDIPPYSIVVVTGVEITVPTNTNESIAIRHVTQYSGQAGNILVTGPILIPAAMMVAQNRENDIGWWNPNHSYGTAYADQRLYVAIDVSVDMPLPGAEWGPVPGKWFVGPSGHGFYADGYPQFSSSSSSGVTWDNSQLDPTRAIFARGTPLKKNYGMIRSAVSSGTLSNPTLLTFDVWLPGQTGSLPVAYSPATDSTLLGMSVTNIGCFSVSSSSTSSGSGSSGSSGAVIQVPGRIEYDAAAGQWVLQWVGRCTTVATAVWCDSHGLNVTYGSLPG